MKRIEPKPYIGIIAFVIVMIIMILAMAPAQQAWGMWGLALTEITILACSLLTAFLMKWDFKKVFQMKLPGALQICGVIILWMGTYILAMLTNIVTYYFFPDAMAELSVGMTDIFTSVPFVIGFFIMAVMPAICEESLHRGIIVYGFSNVKNKWVTIICVGIIFGVFHLSFYRFAITAILGMTLTYIMLETKNILLPMLFHFINNALSAVVTYTSNVTEEQTKASVELLTQNTVSMGVYCVICTAVPFLLIAGSRFIHSKEYNDTHKLGVKQFLPAGIIAALLFFGGLTLITYGISSVDLSQYMDMLK